MRFQTLLLAMILGFSAVANSPITAREDQTIRAIARTLDRLGETKVAKRLIADHFERKRISFGEITKEGEMAETSADKWGTNRMKITNLYLPLGDSSALNQSRPYGPQSTAVPAALTVLHEYVHMAQVSPDQVPKYEDAAYTASDAALSRWVKTLQKEWDAAQSMTPGILKDRKIQELKDLISAVNTESGSFYDNWKQSEKNRVVNYGLKLKINDTIAACRKLHAQAKNVKIGGTVAPPIPTPTAKPKLAWVRIEKKPFMDQPGGNYVLSGGEGAITWNWSLNNDAFGFTSTWTIPPDTIQLTDTIKIDVTCTVTTNRGNDYSANGTFDVWFDRPDIAPGFVGNYIGLKSDQPGGSGYTISHRDGKSGPKKTLTIAASSLPGSVAGSKISFLVAAYIGRVAGYRYTYELQEVK